MINNPIKSLEFDKEYTLTPQYVEPDLSLSEGKILLGEFDESHDNIMSIRTSDTLNYVDNTLFTTNLSVDNTVTVGTIKNSDKEYVISDNDNNMILKVDSNGLETTKIRATEFEGDVNGSATKLSTVSKTAWGQTYWTSDGIPTSISGSIKSTNFNIEDRILNPYFKLIENDKNCYLQIVSGNIYLGSTSTKSLSITQEGAVSMPSTLNVTGTITGNLSGNASTSDKLGQL